MRSRAAKNQDRYRNKKRAAEWLLEQIDKLHESGDIVMHTSSSTATIVKPNKRIKITLDSNSDQWINVEDIKDGKQDIIADIGLQDIVAGVADQDIIRNIDGQNIMIADIGEKDIAIPRDSRVNHEIDEGIYFQIGSPPSSPDLVSSENLAGLSSSTLSDELANNSLSVTATEDKYLNPEEKKLSESLYFLEYYGGVGRVWRSQDWRTSVYAMLTQTFWDVDKLEGLHKVQRGQHAFVFVSVVNLENKQDATVCKLICHNCHAENVNAEMFINPHWRDRVRILDAEYLRQKPDSNCIHANILRLMSNHGGVALCTDAHLNNHLLAGNGSNPSDQLSATVT